MPMSEVIRALDTNVLLRYLLDDHPLQSPSARRLVDSTERLGITLVALAEIVWVLSGPHYQIPRPVVAREVGLLLARENLIALGFDKAEALAAFHACEAPSGAPGFGDALIAACARSVGVTAIYSFDGRFARAGLDPLRPPATEM
jgi:predicted nucleic acid-binding protein